MTQEVTLSQEEMKEALDNFLIKSYIANGIIKATPKIVKKKLNINITKDILSDVVMSMRCALIELEIQAQCNLDNQEDFIKYYNRVSKMITSFDFSEYENMSIQELRSYLLVWDEQTNEVIKGEHLIKDKVKRACVGIYSLLKGGTCIYMDRSTNIIDQIKKLKLGGYLNE